MEYYAAVKKEMGSSLFTSRIRPSKNTKWKKNAYDMLPFLF